MTATWLRLELRRRRRSLAVLALLIALAAGTVLAAVAGARRAADAVDRLWARTLPADLNVLPNQPGFDWDRIRALPEVEAVGVYTVAGFSVEGGEGWFAPMDTEYGRTVERPVLLAGRMYDPARADEAVITPELAERTGKGVGDPIGVRLYTPEQAKARFSADVGPPAGPEVSVRIVGIVRSTWFRDDIDRPGYLHPSLAFLTAHRASLMVDGKSYANALVRLKGGIGALPAFRESLAAVSGRHDIGIWDMAQYYARHDREVAAFGAAALLSFGLAALAAALVLIGQSIVRYTTATVSDLLVLRPVGLSPAQTVRAATAGPVVAALAGAAGGCAVAYLASAWLPFGSAARREPEPGPHADPLVLLAGGAAIPLLVLVGAAVAAFAATQRPARRNGSTVARWAARSGLPVPVAVGFRFALEPGRGRSAVPVRPALLGAIIGVHGVLAAFTFAAGVSATDPAKFGMIHQLIVPVGADDPGPGVVAAVVTALRADPAVAGVTDARLAVAESGHTSVTLYTHQPDALPIVLREGRTVTGDGEVVLAPKSARDLGVGPGDRVTLTGQRGRSTFLVSGIGFVPEASHNDYATGGWVSDPAYERLFEISKDRGILVGLRAGVDAHAAAAGLTAAASAAAGMKVPLVPQDPPFQLAEIKENAALPHYLGAFLAVLGVSAVGHALATAVRHRRHDVAVMRSLGLTRRQARGIVATQASVLAVIGLLAGVPLGVAFGRVLWRIVADTTPLLYQPPVAVWALILIGPAVLFIANLLAAWPGHLAARLRVGHVLRAE
ncbi:ABC transporter permease [Acrocarpospora sp. B8E8]|uniref:ABC transporter permease n=1 Tax=Acrocarpospora sp. B8E8 TaxID=3153572 RepID=UPI00325CBC02